MFFYLFLFLFSTLLAYMADRTHGKVSMVYVTCVVLLLSYIGGVRDLGVGTDTLVYSENYFNEAKLLKTLKDIVELRHDNGYVLLNYIATKLSNDVWMAHFIVQLFTNGLVFVVAYYTKKRSGLKLSLFTLIYCLIFYNQTFNFMRQYCAMALLLVGLYFIFNKQWKFYVICQICAFFFHPSAILFVAIPTLYFICTVGFKHRWIYGVTIFCLLIFVYVIPYYYYELLSIMHDTDVISDMYANRYGIGGKYGAREGVPKTLLLIVCYMLYFIFVAYKRGIVNGRYTIFLLSIQLLFIAFYLLSYRSIYLYRLSLYFYLPLMLFIGEIISSKQILKLERIGFLMVLLLSWYVYIVMHHGAGSFPYHSQILGI